MNARSEPMSQWTILQIRLPSYVFKHSLSMPITSFNRFSQSFGVRKMKTFSFLIIGNYIKTKLKLFLDFCSFVSGGFPPGFFFSRELYFELLRRVRNKDRYEIWLGRKIGSLECRLGRRTRATGGHELHSYIRD